ncbi:MAG: hypothetical protein QOF78_4225, partial [Phycisphaerales bacterium]|nr:hypothetical protein [Phycisphaerales bacterium]
MADSPPDPLREKRVELILQQLEGIPALPAAAAAVISVAAGNAAAIADASNVLAHDTPFSAHVLKLLQASNVTSAGALDTIDLVLTRRGFETLRHAALAVGVYAAFSNSKTPRTDAFSRDEFWKHSVAVGCAARLLAEQMVGTWGKDSEVEPFEAFTCGLLHDIGKMVLETVLPKSFGRSVEAAEMLRGNIADVERSVIGLDHMVAGKRLAERWELPANIRDCIWLHGQVPSALPSTVARPRLVNLITLADVLVRERHLGYSGNYLYTIPRQNLLDAIGIAPEQVEAVLVSLVDEMQRVSSALGIGEISSGELYQGALAQANKALDRVESELQEKTRRLKIRAKFFEALAGFQGEMRPDAPPQTALRAIGQTAVKVLDVTSAAAFSLIPGQNFAEVLLFDSNGDVFESSLVDCPQRPATPLVGEGPVLSAGLELEWLLAPISPRLAHEQRYWICMEADGGCIGGIVW